MCIYASFWPYDMIIVIAEIEKKILRLVVTDFLCWVPISIMAFINFGGNTVPDVAYAISAIVLLPINSALNPILYSDYIDKLFKLIKNKYIARHKRARQTQNSAAETHQPTAATNL